MVSNLFTEELWLRCFVGIHESSSRSAPDSSHSSTELFVFPSSKLHLAPCPPGECWEQRKREGNFLEEKKKKKDALLLGRFASMAGGDSNICYSY